MPTLKINDIETDFHDSGKGPVLLLLHGLGSSKRDWDKQIAFLQNDFRIIAPDFRAHGKTGIPDEFGVEKMADDMKELLTALDIESAVVAGFSMGGAVAFEMAYRYPQLVEKLIIINSGPDFNQMPELGIDLLKTRTEYIQNKGLPALAKEIAFNMFPEESQQAWRQEFEERVASNDEDAYLQSFTTLMNWGLGERISEIKQPVLVIGSDKDYTPVQVKEAYTKRLQQGEFVLISDSRHGVVLDQADNLNQVILKFIKE